MLVPEPIAAYAAGIYTADPEASWEMIAGYCMAIGLGTWPGPELHSAASLWAMNRGVNLSTMAVSGRRLRRAAGKV